MLNFTITIRWACTASANRLRQSVWWAVFATIALGGCGGRKATPTADANRLFLEAQQLSAEGNVEQAKESLTASIATEPTKWAYIERAKLNAQADDLQAAADDCEAALKIFPADPDLLWLQEELKKPKDRRFQGKPLPTSANR